MNDESEKRDELRRLIIAYGMTGQFIYDVARCNLSNDEAKSFGRTRCRSARSG